MCDDAGVVIPDDGSVTSLGEDCFYYCESLASITIPDSVTELGERCFGSCGGKLTVYAEKGSAAAEYAEENGIKLELI